VEEVEEGKEGNEEELFAESEEEVEEEYDIDGNEGVNTRLVLRRPMVVHQQVEDDDDEADAKVEAAAVVDTVKTKKEQVAWSSVLDNNNNNNNGGESSVRECLFDSGGEIMLHNSQGKKTTNCASVTVHSTTTHTWRFTVTTMDTEESGDAHVLEVPKYVVLKSLEVSWGFSSCSVVVVCLFTVCGIVPDLRRTKNITHVDSLLCRFVVVCFFRAPKS